MHDAFYRAIVDSSNDAIITKDLHGTITSWNPGAAAMFGYTSSEAVGQPITLIFPPDRYDEEPGILARILRGEKIEHYETVRRRKDGALLDISLNVSPVRDERGRVIGASKIARDITTLKRAQQRFAVTLSSIGDAVIATDRQGEVTYMNSVAEQLTGWEADRACGRRLEEVFRIVNEQTRAPRETPVAKVLRDGGPVRLANHTVLLAKDGKERVIEDVASPIKVSDGSLEGVVLVFRDGTERAKADLAVRRLAAIVEGSDDAIIGKNLRGVVTSWNPGAERLYGYAAQEMIGQSILRIIPPSRRAEEEQILARLERGERIEHFETVRVRKDGSEVEVSLTISPIRDAEGAIVGASKIARDITALRDAERRLRAHSAELEKMVRERTASLEASVRELEAFSYSLSHDMRAPLRAIQSYNEIVVKEAGSRIPEHAEYLHRSLDACRRLDRLIQDVLAFSRVSRMEITAESLDPVRIARETIAERPELHAPDVTIIVRNPIPRVLGHEASLVQCLSNLLDNAVKFVAPKVSPHVEVLGEDRGDKVRISVRDNGIGVDERSQAKLFAMFNRMATEHKYPGTGIGLAIVRKAAERMGGSVGVSSVPSKGSTFWIELPKAP